MREYSPLTLTPLQQGARVAGPMTPGRVTLDDPAFSVMTDLREVAAATTTREETIAAAHAQMIRRGVRLLFVLDADGGIGPAEAAGIRRAAHLGNLARKSQDAAALAAYWKQLPSETRVDAAVAGSAARYHLALGSYAEAQAIIEQALEREWNAGLVALYGESAGAEALPQIERAEKWLRGHARDPALLLALGKLCMRQGLWGKAQSYIEASLALEPTHDGHMTLAALMESLGKPQEAVQHFRRSAELAG